MNNNLRRNIQFGFLNTALLMSVATLAQPTGRTMPGTSGNSSGGAPLPTTNVGGVKVLNSPGAPSSKPAEQESFSDKLNLGDYVELDDSIRNEMYGTIDFPNADLKDIIKAISKLTNKNFILDQKIQGRKVTIVSPQAVTKQEAYNAFLSALYMNDLALVSMGKFLKIVDAKSALQSNIRVFVGDYAPASEEIVTLLYPLKHLNAEEIQRFLVDLVPRQGRVSYYPNTNTLVMTDAGLNLRRIISILKAIDVPGHQDQLETIQINYASAKGIAQLIEDILDAQSGGGRTGGAPGARGQPRKTRGGGIITKIVPDERTNSLVVLANGRGVQELKDLIRKLDTASAAGGGNIHIYYCKNAVAEELGTTINALISGQQSTRANNGGNQAPPPGAMIFPPIANAGGRGGDAGVKLEGNIKVTADKATNSLVVVAAGSDYAALKKVLQRLDIPRRQVYVEATIMEINIQDKKNIGVGVNIAGPNIGQLGGFIPSNIPSTDFRSLISSPAGIGGLVAGFKAGQSYNIAGVPFPVNTVTGLIKAMVNSNQGQILHQPQILTSDNKDALIKVTTKVPYLTQTVTNSGTGASTADSINTESVTVSLKITPQLGEDNDLIKLTVEQAIDDFQAVDVGSKSTSSVPQTTTRQANTTVVVRDGDTIVVGGLQKAVSSDTRSKFPLLGDIPVLGFLFRGTTADVLRSNLILFLKPKIISEYNDILKITSDKIEEREEMIEKHAETKDRTGDSLKKIKAASAADLLKPAPTTWGFKPKNGENDIDATDADDDLQPPARAKKEKVIEEKSADSAYIDPKAVGITPTLQSDATKALEFNQPTGDGMPGSGSAEIELIPPSAR